MGLKENILNKVFSKSHIQFSIYRLVDWIMIEKANEWRNEMGFNYYLCADQDWCVFNTLNLLIKLQFNI